MATIEKVLTGVARVSGQLVKKGAENFATNFVADSGSQMINQALTGQKVTVGDDFDTAAKEATGTALFAAGGASLADGAKLTGAVGKVLSGGGKAGNAANGALGNIAGGLTADLTDDSKDTVSTVWDVGTNAATGATGNAGGHKVFQGMEEHGSFGGRHLSDRGKVADAAYKNSVGTGINTAVYEAGAGIESDMQDLAKKAE
ncbi:hypothetical protein [Streptomyces sp. WZ-12]|uniref:hypothetical protein n=1 Tax=Streptomyces sp. WZ-12 TaxID=3030210 RepID=UPI0023810FE8|nr:hypothetical protein [Streptomyces sp. WZ-12]